MRTTPVVSMRGIRKSFGPVEVLRGVDFDVLPGEVHVVAGENGAGKSTLIKILSGVYADFAGELQVRGRLQRFSHPKEASAAGIATIHQELSLVPSMSVADNLFLGREMMGTLGQVDVPAQVVEAARILEEMKLECSPSQLVAELPISSQQLLEIARALARDAALLIFDEPTSALNERETAFLFQRIVDLRRQGRGIVYITHRMEEIYRLADRITVLRDGGLVGTATVRELPPHDLVRWMVGRDLLVESRPPVKPFEAPALEVTDLHVAHAGVRGRLVVDGVSFTLRRGEILGLAGLRGSGTSEVLHGLFGALGSQASGQVRLCGEPFVMQGPRESIRRGLLLLTNDRKLSGLAPELSVLHNASLAALRRFCAGGGWIRQREERKTIQSTAREFRLHAPSLDAPARTLSGGNQQKVYLARCLLPQPRVLLLDEPTRGIDVGAKADIYALMRTWVEQGIAILLIASEMDELLALSDRVLVMHRGRVAAELAGHAATKDTVLAAAMGQADCAPRGGSR